MEAGWRPCHQGRRVTTLVPEQLGGGEGHDDEEDDDDDEEKVNCSCSGLWLFVVVGWKPLLQTKLTVPKVAT